LRYAPTQYFTGSQEQIGLEEQSTESLENASSSGMTRGSLSNLRSAFEVKDQPDAPFLPNRDRGRPMARSSSCTNVKKMFERKADESLSPVADIRDGGFNQIFYSNIILSG
jgi:hypothetical protein